MCGIAGAFGAVDPRTVEAMLRTLAHRGPDDHHLESMPACVIGARRLAILDLESGRQPIANETRTVWAALNGEIYNFPDLYATLARQGHRLRTHCDTELLPHLYEQYGAQLPEWLDGMFAIALWDDAAQRGLLIRDRVGKKPLYYTVHEGALFFASELKALLKIPGFSPALNLEALHHYLSLKNVPHPLSILEGVSVLPPAHMLSWQGGRASLTRYWSPSFVSSPEISSSSDEELADQLEAHLETAVRKRLLSDVPVGFFLSGGLDSSLVAALAARVSGKVRTFALVYPPAVATAGKEADRKWASWVANRIGADHYEAMCSSAEFNQSLPDIITAFDEPFAGVTSTYFLSGLIAQHVKVALSGDGADELFGSYLSHRLARPLAGEDVPLDRDKDIYQRLAGLGEAQWRSRLHVFTDDEKCALYSPATREALHGVSTEAMVAAEFREVASRDPLNRVLEAEFRHQLPDQVLTFVDRLSMAHSLEVRAPFLDTALVEFAGKIPGDRKMPRGRAKHILKVVARRFFPEELVERPKEGFVMPTANWLGRLEPWVRKVLSPDQLEQHGLFDGSQVARLVDRAMAEPSDTATANKVQVLMAFQTWWNLYRH